MMGTWPWLSLALLGAYHGLNPGMGWLFALARGLQEKSRSAVAWSLVSIALGHAIAITLAILLLRLVQGMLPFHLLKFIVAGVLIGLGVYRGIRARHPRGAGMRVGWRGLTWWSFLMASTHGAGLMVIPVVMAYSGQAHIHEMTMADQLQVHSSGLFMLSVLVHTMSMLLVAGILAMIFYATYEKTGLSLLRRAWFNFDLLWAIALLVAGFAVMLL